MNPRTTWTLVFLVALAAGLIWFVERPYRAARQRPQNTRLLPGLDPQKVNAIHLRISGRPEIRVERHEGRWRMVQPLAYPAQAERIDRFLAGLESLDWSGHITAQELSDRPNVQQEFGFASPQIALDLFQGGRKNYLLVGNKTVLGDLVYVQELGGDGIHLVDQSWLETFPEATEAWRDPRMLALNWAALDTLRVRAGTRSFELQRDPTNRWWRLTKPFEARANNPKIEELLLGLQKLQVRRFVSDDARTDFEQLGLQPAELELQFLQDTNLLADLQVGSSPTNEPALRHARLHSHNTVVLLGTNTILPWQALPEEFRDKSLFNLPTNGIDALDVHGDELFSLRRLTNGSWHCVSPQQFPADTTLIHDLLSHLASLEMPLEKAVVTDFSTYGLNPPALGYVLLTAGPGANASNIVLAALDFGTNQAGAVFVRRTDETSVNRIDADLFDRLPRASWQLRDRRIWSFASTDVIAVTVRQRGQVRKVVRNAQEGWALAPGSQGIINPFSLEEALHRLSQLTAIYWSSRGDENTARFGFEETAHRLEIELRRSDQPEVLTLDFGKPSEYSHPYATTLVDGKPLVFEFPWPLYAEFIRNDLMIAETPEPKGK